MFLFLFGNDKERRRFLEMEPWIFDKYLVVLKEVNGDDVPDWNGWCLTPFWVQAQSSNQRDNRED